MNLKIVAIQGDKDLPFVVEFASFRERIREKKFLLGGPSKEQTQSLIMWGLLHQANFWLIKDDADQTILRLSARALPHLKREGVIGLFEIDLNSQYKNEAFRLATDTATAWLKERGVKLISAPVDLTTWFNYRFSNLEDKKAWPRFNWEPTTPPEYEELFRGQGFTDHAYYHSVFFPHFKIGPYHLGSKPLRKSYDMIATQGFSLRKLDLENLQEKELPKLHEIVHDAFDSGFMFEPIDLNTFSFLYAGALKAYDFSPSAALVNPQGETVGFIFAFYDGDYLIIKSLAIKKQYQGLNLSSGLIYNACKQSFLRKVKGTISALVKTGIASESIEKNVKRTLWFSWSHRYILLKKEI